MGEAARIQFITTELLLAHVSRMHFGYQPFQCGHCAAVFPTLSDINRHMEMAHGGDWQVRVLLVEIAS